MCAREKYELTNDCVESVRRPCVQQQQPSSLLLLSVQSWNSIFHCIIVRKKEEYEVTSVIWSSFAPLSRQI